jgi:ubiquinone/menaquinone biosynthesis C-methylase UbiE
MRRPEFIARLSARPTGLLGSVIARIMANETLAANDSALRLLDLQPADRVLEVGFAHGRTIERVAEAIPSGFVAGVEVSEQMVRMASRRNRRYIEAGRVQLRLWQDTRLPFDEATFDKVYCVHVIYFWPEPQGPLREIFRVLRSGGRLVLGFRSRSDQRARNFPSTVYTFYEADEIRSILVKCGYQVPVQDVASDGTRLLIAVRPSDPS